jgi:hypothetical protein
MVRRGALVVAIVLIAGSFATASPAVAATTRSSRAPVGRPATSAVLMKPALRERAAASPTPADWFESPAAQISPGLSVPATAFDPATGYLVEFGGITVTSGTITSSSNTLVFDGQNWEGQSIASPPAPRGEASMVYDPALGEIVLFGGNNGDQVFGDTWAYNGEIWVKLSPTTSPPARSLASMAYDPATGKVVLFGGENFNNQVLGDTWTFDGTDWSQQSVSSSPSARYGAPMVYDPSTQTLVLYGGAVSVAFDTDMWEYTGTSWQQLSETNTPPPGEDMMDFDAAAHAFVLTVSNSSSNGGFFETWVDSSGNWVEQSPTQSPPWRVFSSMAFDPALGQMVLFGGEQDIGSATFFGDTWLYGVPAVLTQTSRTIYEVTEGHIATDLGLEGSNLEVSGASVPVSYTTTEGSSAAVTVSPTGALSAQPALPPGNYALSGTDGDAIGDTGSWSVEIQVGAAPVVIVPGGSALPGSTEGSLYSQQFSAELSPGPYTWSISAGILPPGLSLSPSGLLGGRTTLEGKYSFTVSATASAGYGASVATSLTVTPTLSVVPASMPGVVAGYRYAIDLGLSGGVAPATFSLAVGSSLPSGLGLSSNGVLSGTPSGSGLSTFSVVGTDGDGFSTTANYSVFVEGGPTNAGISISPSSMPAATLGAQYDQQLSASGGTAPYSWAITDGSLPDGFSLTSGGIVHGKWNEGEASPFTVTVTDATGASTIVSFTLVVQGAAVVISPAVLAEPTIDYGMADPQVFSISGGTAPYSWEQIGGSLPFGMSLSVSGSTVTLQGTAQQSGTFSFTLNGIDDFNTPASRSYTLTVNPYPTIVVTPRSIGKAAIVGVPWSMQLEAKGGTAPYVFSVNDGALPAGITLSATGLLSGTPTVADAGEPFTFQIEAIDAHGYFGDENYNQFVTTPTMKLGPKALPDPIVGTAYNQLVDATGGGTPYRYAVSAGLLPAGLHVHATSGQITGTPTVPGPASFTITATDANGYTTSLVYKVAVLSAPTFTSAPTAVVQAKLAGTKITIDTTGSYPTPLISLSGDLPAGLTFNAANNGTATITGKVTSAAGSSTVTITANNRAGSVATEQLTIMVYGAPLLPASRVFYPGLKRKYTIETQIPASLISITGLPSWVDVQAGTQPNQIVVTGTAPIGTPVGTYPAVVSVQDLAAPANPPNFAVIVAV